MLTKNRIMTLIDLTAQDLPLIPTIDNVPEMPLNAHAAMQYIQGYADGLRYAYAALERFRLKVHNATDHLEDEPYDASRPTVTDDWI